ncbi:MAG: GIY-YIG nuclease family protein [Proteobacteria bacterium]|nr:GIY-YIG nuclease family protein [Pseudomonadota bacterium]
MWYVYFLCLCNGDIYVGSTSDLRRRVASHGRGQVASTKQRLPAALTSYVAVQTEGTARERERYFKSGSGKAFANKGFWSFRRAHHRPSPSLALPVTGPRIRQ